MTELINPHPVHWAGVGLEQRRIHGSEDRPDPSSRAAQFSKTIRRSRRVSPPPTLSRGPQKRPLVVRGPIWGRRLPAESGLLATRLLLLGTVARATEKYSQRTQEGRVADPNFRTPAEDSPKAETSRREQADEAALAHLQDPAGELLDRQIEAIRRDALAVEPHATLRDQPAPLAAGDLEDAGDQRGQVDWTVASGPHPVGIGQGELRNVVRHSVGDVDGVEPGLRLPGGLGAVKALHDPAGELPLRLRWVPGGRLVAQEQLVVGTHRLVGDAHQLPEHLLRRIGDADIVAERLAHLLPAVRPGKDGERHDRLLRDVVGALDVPGE